MIVPASPVNQVAIDTNVVLFADRATADRREFAEKLIERPKALWLESSPDHRQRLQGLFFPDGVTYTKEGFGTAASHSFFNVLREFTSEKVSLVSPMGFEPMLSP